MSSGKTVSFKANQIDQISQQLDILFQKDVPYKLKTCPFHLTLTLCQRLQ